MRTKIFLRAAVLNFLWIISSVAALKKCCPDGEIVQVDSFEDNNLSPRNHFSCVSEAQTQSKAKKRRQSEGYDMINSTMNVSQLIAYNVLIDENSHWPSCGDNSLLSSALLGEPVKSSESESCVDVMFNNYHIFSCDERSDLVNDFVDIYKLRKCCGKDFSYDVFMRQCVTNNETTIDDDFRDILENRVVSFEIGIPECQVDDVLVEYHSSVHKLKFFESSLIITGLSGYGPDVLPYNSYCIESTMNSYVDMPAGDKFEHHRLKTSSKWIAKVCRNRMICKQMPCVRKCCKEGERMFFENGTSCEDHHAHLTTKFHDFVTRNSREKPNAIEPSGESQNSSKLSVIYSIC
jgi:G protein-coupled receptor Mth (Methuselah protein)